MENIEKLDVSVILPIDSAKNVMFDDLFTNAIRSVQTQIKQINELVIVHSGEELLKNKLNDFDFSGLTVNIIENTKEFDFCTQVNLGVKNAKSTWISV